LSGRLFAQLNIESNILRVSEIKHMQVMAGSILVVPEGKQWEILSLSISTEYMPISVSSLNYEKPLYSGDTILLPSWISEAELHDGNDSEVMYNVKIREWDK
tara:strand:+ start:5076 stop:5381 length:306 start_codon:yes stop_codon:yes gene_type:complete